MAESLGREGGDHYPDHIPPYPGGPPSQVADPSYLTTEQLRRELASLLRLVETRMDAIEAAAKTFREDLTRVPTILDRELTNLGSLMREQQLGHEKETREKFAGVAKEFESVVKGFEKDIASLAAGIARQFTERDVRTDQSAIGTAKAVDAALSAQKEAASAQNEANSASITKSEVNTTKLIDGLGALMQSTVKATDEKISDIKGRLDRGEGSNAGAHSNQMDRGRDIGVIVSVIAVAISAIVFVMNFASHKP